MSYKDEYPSIIYHPCGLLWWEVKEKERFQKVPSVPGDSAAAPPVPAPEQVSHSGTQSGMSVKTHGGATDTVVGRGQDPGTKKFFPK